MFLNNKRPPAQRNATLPGRSSTVALVNFGSNDLLQAVFQAAAAYATTNDTTVLQDVVNARKEWHQAVGDWGQSCGMADQAAKSSRELCLGA